MRPGSVLQTVEIFGVDVIVVAMLVLRAVIVVVVLGLIVRGYLRRRRERGRLLSESRRWLRGERREGPDARGEPTAPRDEATGGSDDAREDDPDS